MHVKGVVANPGAPLDVSPTGDLVLNGMRILARENSLYFIQYEANEVRNPRLPHQLRWPVPYHEAISEGV